MKKYILAALSSLLALSPEIKAGSVTLDNFSMVALNPGGSTNTNVISAIWGSYASGTFTPFFSSTQSDNNIGYLDSPQTELYVYLQQADNSIVTASSQLFVSIFNAPGGAGYSTWSNSLSQIVLSDPSWITPSFTEFGPNTNFSITANTIANPLSQFGGSTGTFSFNGGSPQVTLVPEPSTYALLGLSGLAFAGYVLRRRRRA